VERKKKQKLPRSIDSWFLMIIGLSGLHIITEFTIDYDAVNK